MSQTDDLYTRMVNVEREIEELEKAIVKFRRDLEEEIYNVSAVVDIMRDEELK